MLAADNFLPECVAPEAAGRELADVPTAAGFQADIVERGYVDVALIVERQRHQRIGDPRVLQRNSRRQAHHAVVELIFRPVNAVIVQKAERHAEGVRRLVPGTCQHILETVEGVADLFYVNGLAEAVAQGVLARAALAGASPGASRLQRVLPIRLPARAAHRAVHHVVGARGQSSDAPRRARVPGAASAPLGGGAWPASDWPRRAFSAICRCARGRYRCRSHSRGGHIQLT